MVDPFERLLLQVRIFRCPIGPGREDRRELTVGCLADSYYQVPHLLLSNWVQVFHLEVTRW